MDRAGGGQGPGLKRQLRFSQLLVFGLVYMAPISAVTVFGLVDATSAGAVVPVYALATLALVLTALSYGEMARALPTAGSVYGYATLSLGPRLGFLGGWAILLDYILVPTLGVVAGGLFTNLALPTVSALAWTLVFLAIATVGNLRGLQWSTRLDVVISGLQLALLAAFVVAAVTVLAGNGGITMGPVVGNGASLDLITSGAAIAVLSFLGFDAISTLSEEVLGDRRGHQVAAAVLLSLCIVAVIYTIVSWLLADLGRGMSVNPTTAAFEIIGVKLGWLFLPMALGAGLCIGIGTGLPPQAAVSRVIYAMARDRQLPAVLARIHPTYRTPWVAVLLVGAVTVAGAFAFQTQLDLLVNLVNFGALTAFAFVNLSVLVHMGWRGRSRRWLCHWLLPASGMLVTLYLLLGMHPTAQLVGLLWLAVGLLVQVARHLLTRRKGRAGSPPGQREDAA